MKLTKRNATIHATTATPGRVLTATMELRWSRHGRLQRAWRDMIEGGVEWRDIPVENETDEGRAAMEAKE